MSDRRPLVTFALFAFNQEQFVSEAVSGALAQDYESLEIILSDDNSTDDTFNVMRKLVEQYDGPHIVRLRRNEINLGIGKHVSSLLSIARGDWIILAAGDDISESNRATAIVDAFLATSGSASRPVSVISSAVAIIDEEGRQTGSIAPSTMLTVYSLSEALRGPIGKGTGCSMAYSKSIVDLFGPLPAHTINEDMVLPIRGGVIGSFLYLPDVLVKYRMHATNTSMRKDRREQLSDRISIANRFVRNWFSNSRELKRLAMHAELDAASDLLEVSHRLATQAHYFNALRKAGHAPVLYVIRRPSVQNIKWLVRDLLNWRRSR